MKRNAPGRYDNVHTADLMRTAGDNRQETPRIAITLTGRNLRVTQDRVSVRGPAASATGGFGVFWLGITAPTDDPWGLRAGAWRRIAAHSRPSTHLFRT